MSSRSLFASSYLGLIHIFLDQNRYDEMRILGCEALYDFVTNQVQNSLVNFTHLHIFPIFSVIINVCV